MTAILGAAIAVFVIAALLFWQSHTQGLRSDRPFGLRHESTLREDFRSLPPVAGRPYGSVTEDDRYFIPADLSKAPRAGAATAVPTTATRPLTVPGPATAPRDPPATQKDLQELDERITTWLMASDQFENEHPGRLTPEQKQQRVIYQARVSSLRNQLGTGRITDTVKIVAQEIADMRRENQAWTTQFPGLEELHSFGIGRPPSKFLNADEYREFRSLFDAGLNELKNHPQPDPLERVRFQQLQVIQQDLMSAEKTATTTDGVPSMRIGPARLFLMQMLRPDQPLPTLFAMEANPAAMKRHADSPADVIAALKDVQWKFTVQNNPAAAAVTSMLHSMTSNATTLTPQQVAVARAQVVALRNSAAPAPASASASAMPSGFGAPLDPMDREVSEHIQRARTLCHQMIEAFGESDAAALGCPVHIDTKEIAGETIGTVCQRLRYSVPTVDPAQFNCPK